MTIFIWTIMKTPHFWLVLVTFYSISSHFVTHSMICQDPDVINTPLPVEYGPSVEEDGTVIRPEGSGSLTPLLMVPLYVPGCFHHWRSPTGPQTYKATKTGPSRTGSGYIPRNIGDLLGWAGSCSWSLSRTVASSPRAPAVLQEQFIIRQPEAKEQDKKPLEPHLRFLGPGEFRAREDSPLPHPVHASVLQPHVHVCPVHYLRVHWPWSRS